MRRAQFFSKSKKRLAYGGDEPPDLSGKSWVIEFCWSDGHLTTFVGFIGTLSWIPGMLR